MSLGFQTVESNKLFKYIILFYGILNILPLYDFFLYYFLVFY